MLEEMLNSLSKATKNKNTESEIQKILAKKVKAEREFIPNQAYWSCESFGLQNVDIYNSLSSVDQETVLKHCSQMRLEEAYYIEFAGMSYAAKMSILATTVEEQKLYSLFAAEEAKHFNYITQFFSPDTDKSAKPFVEFLNHTIATGERMPLILIIQVLLEGWGLDHYQRMTSFCTDQVLSKYLAEIVADEASHHGSGVILFNEDELSESNFDFVLEVMSQFLADVRVGPTGLIECLESVTGELKGPARDAVLQQLDAPNDTKRKLTLLKRMMTKVGAHKVVQALEEHDLFSPKLA